MADCDIRIVFDRDEPAYKAGEEVTGRVIVEVNEETTCDVLELSMYWETHGMGTQNSGEMISLSPLARNEQWRPGKTYEYEFSFEAPPGPTTYHGNLLNVDWYLYVNADIPWAFDPSCETEFLVQPGDLQKYNVGSEEIETKKAFTGESVGGTIGKIFLGVMGLVFILSLPGLYMYGVIGEEWSGLSLMALFVVMLLIGSGFVFVAIRNTLAQMKIGDVKAGLSELEVGPGEEISFGMEFTPDSQVELHEIRISAECDEWVRYSSGTNTHSRSKTVWETEFVPEEYSNTTFQSGETVRLADSISLPEDAPCSFSAPRNKVRWKLEIHVDIASWPDWKDASYFIVTPQGAEVQ